MKVARYATGRSGVVAFDHGFHGRTLLGLSLTGKAMPYKRGFGPFAPEVYRAPYSDPFRGTGTLAADHRRASRRRWGRPRSRAWWWSPSPARVVSWCPSRAGSRGWPQWCWRQRGRASWPTRSSRGSDGPARGSRASTRGSCPTSSPPPRASGGGLPIAAVTGRAELMDTVHPGGLGGTFGGNPLACAAALAAIETMESDGLLERARRHRRRDAGPPRGHGRRRTRPWATPAAGGPWWRSSWWAPTASPPTRRPRPGWPPPATPKGLLVLSAGHLRQRRAPAAPARDPRRSARRGPRHPGGGAGGGLIDRSAVRRRAPT